jgi:hypothetical protein
VLIARGYSALGEITDDDLAQIPSGMRGEDGSTRRCVDWACVATGGGTAIRCRRCDRGRSVMRGSCDLALPTASSTLRGYSSGDYSSRTSRK